MIHCRCVQGQLLIPVIFIIFSLWTPPQQLMPTSSVCHFRSVVAFAFVLRLLYSVPHFWATVDWWTYACRTLVSGLKVTHRWIQIIAVHLHTLTFTGSWFNAEHKGMNTSIIKSFFVQNTTRVWSTCTVKTQFLSNWPRQQRNHPASYRKLLFGFHCQTLALTILSNVCL